MKPPIYDDTDWQLVLHTLRHVRDEGKTNMLDKVKVSVRAMDYDLTGSMLIFHLPTPDYFLALNAMAELPEEPSEP